MCQLVFVPSKWHLSSTEEKKVYDFHENNLEDIGYRQFLNRLASPLNDYLTPKSTGLDFGCGSAPMLKKIMEESGHQVQTYDPYYFSDPSCLKQQYDFVTATEVLEHLNTPKCSIELLISLIKPEGYLGIMTKRVKDQNSFANWHYIRDPTHISFFSIATFEYLSQTYHLAQIETGKDTIIFQKKLVDTCLSLK